MRKLIALLIVFFALSLANSQIWIEREVPKAIVNEPVKITEKIISGESGQIDYSILLPLNWNITNWTLENVNYSFEKRDGSYKGKFYTIYHFIFHASEDQKINLNYTIFPEETGKFKIVIIWFTPTNFNEEEYSLNVTTKEGKIPKKAICGNNICETSLGENKRNCPNDCPFETYGEYYVIILTFATYISIFGLVYQIYKHKLKREEEILRPKFEKKKNKKEKKKKKVKGSKSYKKVLEKLSKLKKKLK